MGKDMRVGVVGYGLRGSLAKELHAAENARVVAVCDPSPRAQRDAAQDFPDAFLTDSLEELLELELDAALVLTPDEKHAEVALPLLRAGIPVFCEKPLATSLEDADAILETAFATGTRLYVGHNMRHMPVITLMKDLVDQGTIGDVKAVWCRHFVGHGGDFYFKDWHAERSKSVGLLLQKGAHDIDVIHWLAGEFTEAVQAVGSLSVYGSIADRRDRSGERMPDWFSLDNWPPTELKGLNPIIDVEDISQLNMVLSGGVLASYQQCHFTPDYWRNYTVIGTKGRLENFGDGPGAKVGIWNRRHSGQSEPDKEFVVPEATGGHGGADALMVEEFLRFVQEGGITNTCPVAARNSVATGLVATASLRGNGCLLSVPPLQQELRDYFAQGQVKK